MLTPPKTKQATAFTKGNQNAVPLKELSYMFDSTKAQKIRMRGNAYPASIRWTSTMFCGDVDFIIIEVTHFSNLNFGCTVLDNVGHVDPLSWFRNQLELSELITLDSACVDDNRSFKYCLKTVS